MFFLSMSYHDLRYTLGPRSKANNTSNISSNNKRGLHYMMGSRYKPNNRANNSININHIIHCEPCTRYNNNNNNNNNNKSYRVRLPLGVHPLQKTV